MLMNWEEKLKLSEKEKKDFERVVRIGIYKELKGKNLFCDAQLVTLIEKESIKNPWKVNSKGD